MFAHTSSTDNFFGPIASSFQLLADNNKLGNTAPSNNLGPVVDLLLHPGSDPTHPASPLNENTIGDLHANTLKQLAFLINQNVMEMSPNDYAIIVYIFKKVPRSKANEYFNLGEDDILTRFHIDLFNHILSRAKILPVGLVRYIGDEIVDRAGNDVFNFLLKKRLKQAGVNLELIASNHAIEFIIDRETKRKGIPGVLAQAHAASMFNLKEIMDEGLFTEEELQEIYEEYYSPCVKLLSYSLQDLGEGKRKITLFTHAGVDMDLNHIHYLADKFQIPYDNSSPLAFAKALPETIDRINAEVQNLLQNKSLHTLISNDALQAGYEGGPIDPQQYPIEYFLWNRNYFGFKRTAHYADTIYVDYVHGHDPSDPTQNNIYNLDQNNQLGKTPNHNTGPLRIHCVQNTSLKMQNIFVPNEKIETEEKVPETISLLNKAPLNSSYAPLSNEDFKVAYQQVRPKLDNLLNKIHKLRKAGYRIAKKDQADAEIAIQHADALASNVMSFFMQIREEKRDPVAAAQQFEIDFRERLHSQDTAMAKHRKLWKPVIANIAIAMTGIGFAAILLKLIVSKVRTGHASFFYHNTNRMNHVHEVASAYKAIAAPSA